VKKPDPVRRRIADVRKLLAAQLESDQGTEELEKLTHQLELLEGLARVRRRRRSILWAAGAVAAALIAAALLRFSRLDQVDIALDAETRAFVFFHGEATNNILPTSVLLREVKVDGQQIDLCTDPERLRPFACKPAAALRLNRVDIHTKSTAAVRQVESCFEVEVLEGGASAMFSVLPWADPTRVPAGTPIWRLSETADLHPGESVRFCPLEGATLHCSGITSIMIGDRIGGAPSEQEDAPALSEAGLSLPSTGESETFLGTDILHFGDLSNGVAVVRFSNPLKLSLVGRAKRLTVQTGSHRRNLMPSWLDWVRGKPELKATLALLVTIFGAVVAVRERWLGELN
jgi:hypothetical protein